MKDLICNRQNSNFDKSILFNKTHHMKKFLHPFLAKLREFPLISLVATLIIALNLLNVVLLIKLHSKTDQRVNKPSLSSQPSASLKKGADFAQTIGVITEWDQQMSFAVVELQKPELIKLGDTLQVRHRGKIIGKIKLTRIKANKAIAELVIKSFKGNPVVQIGDTLIF